MLAHRALALSLTGTLCVACGGGAAASSGAASGDTTARSVADNTNAPPPERYEPPPVNPAPATQQGAPTGPRAGSGTSREDPVMACGPADSYAYVAQQFRCPDGTNPLGGDPAAGRDARVGNVGANSSGHIIDLYRVPCAGGPVDVYVDMYGCPEMEGALGGI